MSRARLDINAAMLRWALQRAERSGVTRESVQKKCPDVHEWLSRQKKPTLKDLEEFAHKTLTPLGFLFLDEPPRDELPIAHFRTHADQEPHGPSPNLLDTVHAMQRRQLWFREHLIEQGQAPLPFVDSATRDEPAASTAQRIRDTLGLDHGWAAEEQRWTDALQTLRGAMEYAGILVVVNGVVGNNTHRKLDPDEFRGFVLVDEYAPLAFVNGADAKAAQMFTLAHELAHIFFGSSAAFDLRDMQPADDATENACNSVAAEFLVPRDDLVPFWRSLSGDRADCINQVAREFKVSSIVAARRALDLELIDCDEFSSFYSKRQADWRATSSRETGGDFYKNQHVRVGKRFFLAVYRAVKEGRLLYREAYRLTDLRGRSFDNYASSLLGSEAP